MPIYEYRCSGCGTSSEKIQRQPQQEIDCPVCGKPARRSVSAFAVAGGGSDGGSCSAPTGSGFT